MLSNDRRRDVQLDLEAKAIYDKGPESISPSFQTPGDANKV